MTMLAWGARVSAQFRRIAVLIAQEGRFDPSDLMAVMAFETGRTFSAKARNPISGATGLLQFIRSTAEGMGYTLDQLAEMADEEQLRIVVRKYLTPYYGRCRTLSDLYMAVLWPKAVGQPETFVLFGEGSTAYLQNKGLDVDKDGKITKAEAAAYVARLREEGLRPENATVMERIRDDQEEVTQMEPGTTTTQGIGGLLGMLHPAANILFNVFAPAIKQRIADKVDSVSGTPGAGQAVADALSDALLGSAKQQTGKDDELEAVAVARQDPAKVAAAQQAAMDAVTERLKQLAPVLVQTAELDRLKWEAEREGRDAASRRAIEERKAGLWDMTPFLVRSLLIMLWGIAWGLLGAILTVALQKEPNAIVLTALFSIAGPIWTGAIVASVIAIVAYRFDGTKESSKQTDVMLALANRQFQLGGSNE